MTAFGATRMFGQTPMPAKRQKEALAPSSSSQDGCSLFPQRVRSCPSAARALQNGVPNIERADKLVQLIAKQKGLSHPAIDAQVALVDRRIEANRKKAAAA
jgi:hypothetical protein